MRSRWIHVSLSLAFFTSLAGAGTITTISGACIMNNGEYSQSWSDQFDGNVGGVGYTCDDPAVPDSQITFFAWATASISPSGAAVSEGAYSSPFALPCCNQWTTVEETVTIQEQETFIATGGSGQGFIEGECAGGVYGGAVGVGGSSFGSQVCALWDNYGPSTPIPFTFGQPFTLFIEATSETPDSYPNDVNWVQQAFATEVVDAAGDPIANVVFTAVPEPGALLLLGTGLCGLAASGAFRSWIAEAKQNWDEVLKGNASVSQSGVASALREKADVLVAMGQLQSLEKLFRRAIR